MKPTAMRYCQQRERRTRAAFTLVELLVVIAMIGVLLAILLPAIQATRESARRTQCGNQLRQLGLAATSHTIAKRVYPAGVEQWYFNTAVAYRGIPLFAFLLPYLEESNVLVNWNYDDPIHNSDNGLQSNTAVVLPLLICPSDQIDVNPVIMPARNWYNALTSYGGNGGTRSYFPLQAEPNGVFHTTGEASEPRERQRPTSPRQISDGISRTLLFGERYHDDPNYESFNADGWGEPLTEWGWWGASVSRKMIGHVTLSAHAPVNFQLPFDYANRNGQTPSAASFTQFQEYVDMRITAYGSGHPGGANFCFADGSLRFLESGLDWEVLRALSTRAGDETIARVNKE